MKRNKSFFFFLQDEEKQEMFMIFIVSELKVVIN
jgi:hypothetical protein